MTPKLRRMKFLANLKKKFFTYLHCPVSMGTQEELYSASRTSIFILTLYITHKGTLGGRVEEGGGGPMILASHSGAVEVRGAGTRSVLTGI